MPPSLPPPICPWSLLPSPLPYHFAVLLEPVVCFHSVTHHPHPPHCYYYFSSYGNRRPIWWPLLHNVMLSFVCCWSGPLPSATTCWRLYQVPLTALFPALTSSAILPHRFALSCKPLTLRCLLLPSCLLCSFCIRPLGLPQYRLISHLGLILL